MTASITCTRCGVARPANAPGGLCPQCLLRLGMGDDLSAVPDRSLSDALSDTIGPLPRIALRESGAWPAIGAEPGFAPDPPDRPGSPEMPAPADRPARLHLFGEIARGGMGAVLRGCDAELGREVAVKVLLEEHRDKPELVRRFIEEAQISGQLQHPGVVPVYELGSFGARRRPYFAMKLVKGHTLAELMAGRADPSADLPRLLSVFHQVAQTVAYAHARGVIHRDLKPSNVMVGGFGEVQVMDWGLAKVLPPGDIDVVDDRASGETADPEALITGTGTGLDAGLSASGSVMGTPAYMAPEQARGETQRLDERCDVFSLGSILCEILTGQPAFTGGSPGEIQRKAAAAEQGNALARLDACGADAELIALAQDCLTAEPRDRPRDAHAVADRVTAHLAGVLRRLRDAELARVEAQARAAEERKRRGLTVALAASVLAMALIGGGGWAWVAHDRASRMAATIGAVDAALDEAAVARARARAAPFGAGARWIEASEAAKRAASVLAQGEASDDQRRRVETLLADVTREYGEARAAAESALAEIKDRRMVERLAEIHADFSVHADARLRDEQFAAAFRDYGIDVDALDPAQAGARIAARPVAVELAGGLDNWAFNRRARLFPHDLAGARRLLAIVRIADPDPWRNRLREVIDGMSRQRRQALTQLQSLAASADPAHLPVTSVNRLASALAEAGDPETAVNLLRVAQQVHPDDFWLTSDLARFLRAARPGDPDEVIRYLTAAVSIRPRSDLARSDLAQSLADRGRLEEAAAVLRESVRLRPQNAHTLVLLGEVLIGLGRPGEAAAVAQQILERDPERADAQLVLGKALLAEGKFAAALDPLRHARDRGTRRGRFDPSASADQLVPLCERLIQLDTRLPSVLKGEDRPADAAELAGFADLCHRKQLHATAARLWSQAFAARDSSAPLTAEDLYSAARAAARAGCTEGNRDEQSPADDAERSRFRKQACDWLEAALAQWGEQLDQAPAPARRSVRSHLTHWQTTPDLAGLRNPQALRKLPAPERNDWYLFWARVDALLARTQGEQP